MASVFAVAALVAVGAPAGAAQSPNASCVAILVHTIGPPGSEQRVAKHERFGQVVSHVAKTPGTTFEECIVALG